MAVSRSILSLALLALLLLGTVAVTVFALEVEIDHGEEIDEHDGNAPHDEALVDEEQEQEEDLGDDIEVNIDENHSYSNSWHRDPELPSPIRAGHHVRGPTIDPIFDPRNAVDPHYTPKLEKCKQRCAKEGDLHVYCEYFCTHDECLQEVVAQLGSMYPWAETKLAQAKPDLTAEELDILDYFFHSCIKRDLASRIAEHERRAREYAARMEFE